MKFDSPICLTASFRKDILMVNLWVEVMIGNNKVQYSFVWSNNILIITRIDAHYRNPMRNMAKY